ncbi:hypothetical protein D3C87_1082170 [compost metagenome]
MESSFRFSLTAFFLATLISSCSKSQVYKSVTFSTEYIVLNDKQKSHGDFIKWKPVQKMEKAINISLNSNRDTIVINYVSMPTIFVKEPITEPEEKTLRKKIKSFNFIGSFRRDEGDGLYNHFYLSDNMDLMMQIKDKPGHLLFSTIYLQMNKNPLEDVNDLNIYLDVEEGKKHNGPIHLKN